VSNSRKSFDLAKIFSAIRRYGNHRIDDDLFLTSMPSNLKISFRSFDVPFRSHYSFGDERNQ